MLTHEQATPQVYDDYLVHRLKPVRPLLTFGRSAAAFPTTGMKCAVMSWWRDPTRIRCEILRRALRLEESPACEGSENIQTFSAYISCLGSFCALRSLRPLWVCHLPESFPTCSRRCDTLHSNHLQNTALKVVVHRLPSFLVFGMSRWSYECHESPPPMAPG